MSDKPQRKTSVYDMLMVTTGFWAAANLVLMLFPDSVISIKWLIASFGPFALMLLINTKLPQRATRS